MGTTKAKKLNLLMQKEAQKVDYVLDLHIDTDAIKYLYTADFAKTHVEKLGYKHMLIINNDKASGALDEAIFCPRVKKTRSLNKSSNKAIHLS